MRVERYSSAQPVPGSDSSGSLPAGSPPPAYPPESELNARFRERIRVFAARRLGEAAAEDVAQETLRRVIEALRAARLRDPAALPAFVFQTARHVCQHRLRGAGREARALERLGHGAAEDTEAATSPDALLALVRSEEIGRVRAALDRLAESDRLLLRLLFYDGLDAGEAARRFGLSGSALRVRKHRALRRLARLLRESGE